MSLRPILQTIQCARALFTPALGRRRILRLSKRLLPAMAGVAMSVTSASADTFGSGINQFTMDFVTIGNAGNPVDTGTTGSFFSSNGAVAYTFQMSTYEVSEDMINKANAMGGLFITHHGQGANAAATAVSWNEAARFVNWLNTSQGFAPAYKFALQPGDAGYTGNANAIANIQLWSIGDAGYNPNNLYRNSNAHYFLPNDDEWYKAAYYSGSGTTYFDYATESNTAPATVSSGTAPGTAVYGALPAGVSNLSAATQAGGLSHYGTMGQNGNAIEWVENAFVGANDVESEARAIRGGGWGSSASALNSSSRLSTLPTQSDSSIGFRVASVPEPSATVLIMGPGLMFLMRKRRARSL